MFIAAIAPLLWIVDSFRSAVFLNDSFIKQLIFPDPSALFLRLLLVFFILIQAWFFNRYSRTKNRVFEIEGKLKSLFDLAQDALVVTDIEGKVMEASGKAQELWGYSLQELSDLDLTRMCAASESERLINFIREIIKNKESGLENVMLAIKDSLTIPADIEGRFIDNLDARDKPGIFLDIVRHKSQELPAAAMVVETEAPAKKPELETPVAKPEPEIPAKKPETEVPKVMAEEERGLIEEAIRQQEAKKSQEALKNLEQKYLELMRVRLAEESKKVEDAVRLEEKKKTEEQIRTLESKASAGVEEKLEEKLKAERGRIEEAIRQEEAKKSQEQVNALEYKYSEILKARVAEARQQAEELAVQEAKKKFEEELRQAKAEFVSESGSKISEGRKLIEDSVRQEEQRKAEESALALRQKYEDLLRKGIEEERKRNEESTKLARSQLESAIRQEENKKREEEIRAFEVKYAEAAGIKMTDERSRIEATVRKEEQQKALDAINELKLKYEETLRKAIDDERRRAEESIKKAEAAIKTLELQSRSKEAKVPEIGKLVSGVGQQMMSPLTAVLNYLKVIKIKLTQGSDLKPLEFKDTINLIEENALLCKNILNSLSNPSLVTKAAFQPVSINDVIARIDSLLGQDLRLQNITVSKALQANLANISGDPLLLTQVVFNLISNAKWAIKSNPYGVAGTLIIKTQSSPNKDLVELLITDNGIGISEKDLPRIFEPFFTTKPDGLGLGLTIAYSIIKEHKGEIQVESKENSGTTFKVIFPALIET